MRALLGVVVVLGGLLGASPAEASLYSETVLADNPTGYWRLNETSGSTAVNSIAGGNDGTVIGGVTLGIPGAIVGDSDTAMWFNGTNGKVDVANYAAINAPSFSFECWARRDGGATSHQSPLTSRNDGPQQGYIFYAEGNTWQFWTGPGWQNLPGGPQVNGQWYHLVGTYDAPTQTKRFYVNGQPAGTATGVTVNTNNIRPLRIGGGATEGLGNYWFNGAVDEVAVYDTVLPSARILAHYEAGTQGTPIVPDQLFRTDFSNPGGIGLGPDASRMQFAGQTNNSPTPTNPDGTLILGGSGTGGLVFVEELQYFTFARPMAISTEAYYANGAAGGGNDYMGLVALHRKGTSDTGAERRGGLYAQFRANTGGTGRLRFGFQSDSTANGGDLWVDELFSLGVSGIPDPNGLFDLKLELSGLEDSDYIRFIVSQGNWGAQIATTVGQYLAAVQARSGQAGAAFGLTLAELRADPTLMNFGFISTDSRNDAYNYLLVEGDYYVPEPGSMALLALGIAGLAARRRRVRH